MSQIKKFIDRVAVADGRQSREVSMTLVDAKLLRDEIMKLLIDNTNQPNKDEVINVVMQGRKW